MSTQNRYDRLKAERRCVRCGEQDELTLQGRSVCDVCRKKLLAYSKKHYQKQGKTEEYRAMYRKVRRERYHKWARNHQCVHCGAKLPEEYYYVSCPKCRQYQAEYQKRKKTAGAATPNGQKENNLN